MDNKIYADMLLQKQAEFVKAENPASDGKKDDIEMDFMARLEELEKNKEQAIKKAAAHREYIKEMNERDRKAEEKENLERQLLRRKRMKRWFERRAEQRKDYTEFLETGKRYVLPCPAVDLLKMK